MNSIMTKNKCNFFEVHHIIIIQSKMDENMKKHQTNMVIFSKHQ